MKTKMLVADDSPETQELFGDLFRQKGFNVIQAFDGGEAIRLFTLVLPEVVLLDIMMPGINGLAVLKQIKEKAPDTIVIMMTAHGSEETAVEAMKLGADDYLMKPIDYKDVLSLVDELVEKNRSRLENIRLKEHIHKTESYLAHLIENVNEAIISTDLEGKIQSFNRAAEKLWHTEEADMKGRPISDLFKDAEKNGYVENLFTLTRESGSYSGEFIFSRADGGGFPGHLSTSSVRSSKGTVEGIVAVIRDLTSEKKLREQLIESAKLAALGRIVEGIAHEIRNPLISMGGFARRLERSIHADAEQKKYMRVILDDVHRLETMVREIEDYVTFTKEHRINFQPLDIRALLADSVNVFDPASKKVEVFLETKALPFIFGDEVYLRTLCNSIIENAMEAMPDGGRIDINFSIDANSLSIIIRDSGRGIPKERLPDIFDPFMTTKMTGAGIGLAKAYMIVEEHSGKIEITSEEGQGTTVHINLPIEKRQSARVIH